MASFIRARLFRAESVTEVGVSTRDAALDDLERLDRVLVVVLGVLFEPPPAARPDLLVLGESAERLFRDLLRHPFDGISRRPPDLPVLGESAERLFRDL